MSLDAGNRLPYYEVVDSIGKGGMREVSPA
jgi:hypothetical protein